MSGAAVERLSMSPDGDAGPIGADATERPALSKLARLLGEQATAPRLFGAHGESVELPPSASSLLKRLARLLAQGAVQSAVSLRRVRRSGTLVAEQPTAAHR